MGQRRLSTRAVAQAALTRWGRATNAAHHEAVVRRLTTLVYQLTCPRPTVVSIGWQIMAYALGIQLSDLCDDPAWLALQPPLSQRPFAAPLTPAQTRFLRGSPLAHSIPLTDEADDPCPTTSAPPSEPSAPICAPSRAATPAESTAPTPSSGSSPSSSSGPIATRSSEEAGPAPLLSPAQTSPPPWPRSASSQQRLADDMANVIAARQPKPQDWHGDAHAMGRWVVEEVPRALSVADAEALSVGRSILAILRSRDAAIAEALERSARAEAAAAEAVAEAARLRSSLRA